MLSKILFRKVDAIGLSVFRIFYAIILCCEIVQLFKFRHIIYDKVPFETIGEIDVSFIFYFWFIVVAFLCVGLFTRITTILNYVFSVIIFSSAINFEYHVFYAYVGINFILMFMPISRVFSLDSLIQKLKYTQIGKIYKVDRTVLEVNYLGPVFIAIGLVYFDSIFHKLSSKMWMDGLGVWLPSSLPMVTWNDTSFLLNQEWLVKFLGYFVLVFEAIFIFMFWFRKWKLLLFFIGVFFHLGILIAYPIPWFALTIVAVYILLIPVKFWNYISDYIKFKKYVYFFYYDAECPLCNKIIVLINHFDIFNTIECLPVQGNYQNSDSLKSYDEEILLVNIHGVTSSGKVVSGYQAYVQLFKSFLYTYPLGVLIGLPGISYLGQKTYNFIAGNRLTERCTSENCFIPVYSQPIPEEKDILIKGLNRLSITKKFWIFILLFFSLTQSMMIWFSPFVQEKIVTNESLNKIAAIPYKKTRWMLVKYFGITRHTVFLNSHFEGFNHIFKIVYVDANGRKNVPILDDNGMPSDYVSGIIWRNISFNVITTTIEREKIQDGILPYLKYYKAKEVTGGSNGKFEFYVKEISIPQNWQKDFLKQQIQKPWVKVGDCFLENKSVFFQWNNSMQQILKIEADEK
jgi:predicted DCC family thiol-disulfide oxidoreductase YuxK